jgi:putative transposase
MKKSRYSEVQIVSILKEAENGVPVSELCRTHGMSSAPLYQWRSKYGGMDASLISEMKQLQVENARLKRMYANMAMQKELVKETLAKSNEAIFPKRDGPISSRRAWCQRCAGMPYICDQPAELSVCAAVG